MWVLLLCKVKAIFKQWVDGFAAFLLIRDHHSGIGGWRVSLEVGLTGQRWTYSSPESMRNTHCLNQSYFSSGRKDFSLQSWIWHFWEHQGWNRGEGGIIHPSLLQEQPWVGFLKGKDFWTQGMFCFWAALGYQGIEKKIVIEKGRRAACGRSLSEDDVVNHEHRAGVECTEWAWLCNLKFFSFPWGLFEALWKPREQLINFVLQNCREKASLLRGSMFCQL